MIIIYSRKKITNIYNDHFISKINKIREKFFPGRVNHMDIINMVFKRVENQAKFPHINIEGTKSIIKKMKVSNSVGHDQSSIKIFKRLNNEISPIIMHLINTIIETAVYPDILKISMMHPILKPDKDPLDPDAYQPINNLCTLDKIIEEYFKQQIQKHLDINNIIDKHHHGSRKNHGTNTALAQINYEISTRYEKYNYTSILQTDLSAAFDTVDTFKLIDKLDFYGVRK